MTLYIDTKPTLEWVEWIIEFKHTLDVFKGCSSKTVFGEYQIYYPNKNDKFEMYLHFPTIEDGHPDYPIIFDLCDTLAEAQAYAQADYERRTAERFKVVEVPQEKELPSYDDDEFDFVTGYNCSLRELHANIAKATEATP